MVVHDGSGGDELIMKLRKCSDGVTRLRCLRRQR